MAAALVALGLVLSACDAGSGDPDPTAPTTEAGEPGEARAYVALGDSAASGMGIPPEEPGEACRRSARAYPVLLAARQDLELDNRTCAGARIEDLLTASADDEPQIAALGGRTELVTVMIGANDLGYGGLVGVQCDADGAAGSEAQSCLARQDDARRQVDERLGPIGQQLRELLAAIGERAPNARVLVVGYGDPLGENGPCEALPMTKAAFALGGYAVVELNAALRDAAEHAGTEFVDTHSVSREHGVCDAEPWTNGFTTDGDGSVGHPRSGYHAAVADVLDDVLDRAP